MGGSARREHNINFRVNKAERSALGKIVKEMGNVSEAEAMRRLILERSSRGETAGSVGVKRET